MDFFRVVGSPGFPLVQLRGGERTAKALRRAELLRIEGMGHDLPRSMWPQLLDALERVTAKASTRAHPVRGLVSM